LKQPIPFGKYYLLERINVGGMAEVFKAKATGVEGFERMVAVKRILPSIAEDDEFITMFVDEAKIAVQLTHANIAQIFDLGKVADSYFIALEYVHGKDMRTIFHRARQRGEQVPIPMACYAIMKVCEGLDYAHNKRDSGGRFLNLVHRDVSPQNLLVSYEGEVKIIDFGIALAAGKAGRTQAGILKGKFGYMSPEQVQQGFEIDRRSDVFGVGICLYELLTGERLFVAETDFATLEKVRNVDIMPPSTYNRRIPEDLEQIVLKALARNRDDRHATAMALHDELQSFMYTSGNFFGRKDLSMYMQRVFAEELGRESARDREYASLELPALQATDDESGLDAFQEIDPVSTVSALQDGMALSGSSPAMASSPQVPRKATLLGMPAVAPRPSGARTSQPRGPAVPRISPRANSIPPGHGPTGSGVRQAAAQSVQRAPGWDDEEFATQIYDKPGEGLDALASQLQYLDPPAPARPVAPAAAAMPATAPVAQPVARSVAPGRDARRGSTGRVVAASIAVTLLLVGLAAWLLRPPKPGELRLTTDPQDAQLRIDGVVVGGKSPFQAGNIVPGTTHLIEVVRENFRPWSIKIQLQPGQAMELPEVVLDPIESGFALDSIPSGASVFVDGAKLPDTTPIRMTKLAPGDHLIRLESDGYARWESSLHVVAGKVLDLPKAQLAPQATDGARVAPAPLAARPTAPPTTTTRRRPRPTVRAPAPAYAAVPVAAPVAPSGGGGGGEGTLRVQTRPWSKVFVDGQLVGTTPQMGIRLPAGSHTLVLVNDDFGIRKTVPIRIRAGETITKVLTLTE
jgi:serine/threonine protein kinase